MAAAALSAAGCNVAGPAKDSLAQLGFEEGGAAANAVAITGRVVWPRNLETQATFTEVVRASTVSLIDSVTNQILATTLTTPELTFVLTIAGFTPQLLRTYYLEAVKGLGENKASNDAIRMRTLIRWTSTTNVQSITVPTLGISVNTTALSAIANLRSLNPDSFLGRINLGPPERFDTSGTGITQEDLTTVAGFINQALTAGRDPLFALRYDGTAYNLDLRGVEEPASVPQPMPFITGLSAYSAVAGDQVTLYGKNFDSPPESNSLKLTGVPCAIVSGASNRLVFTVPPNTPSGTLFLTTAFGTASTPLNVVAALSGDLGGTHTVPNAAPDKTIVGGFLPKLSSDRASIQ